MTGRGEPRWQPISMLPTIASLIDAGLRDGREHYAVSWRPVPGRTSLTTRRSSARSASNGEGLEWCCAYERQRRRWRGQRLTDAQRREIARLEGVLRELRSVLTQILGLADELGRA